MRVLYLVLLSTLAPAEERPIRSAPFDFSLARPFRSKKKGLVERFFDHIDGGAMSGFEGPDWSRRINPDLLHPLTVRIQRHY